MNYTKRQLRKIKMKSFWFVNLGLSSFCCKQVVIVAKRGPRKIWTKCVVEGRAFPTQVSFSSLLLNNSSPLFLLLSDKSIYQQSSTRNTFAKKWEQDQCLCQRFPPELHLHASSFIKCPSNSRATATSEELRACVWVDTVLLSAMNLHFRSL